MTPQEYVFDMVYIDTIDVCQLKCPTCVRGSRVMENTNAKMPLDKFTKIVEKAARQKTRRIGLYNWTEPFLNRDLHKYISVVKENGILVDLSTTLSLRHIDHLEDCLRAGVDHMIVSVSGMTQDIYEINHVGGELVYVLSNLRRVSQIIETHRLSTQVTFRFLQFDYNQHHASAAQSLADELGFSFQVLPADGSPKTGNFAHMNQAWYRAQTIEALEKPSPEDSGKVCPLMFGQNVIDSSGALYLCCAVPNLPHFKIGQHLEMSDGEALLRKFRHPFCKACSMQRRDASTNDAHRLAAAMLAV
jgi:MoaA/NifB/PqqE/SkfB family radical SAM enzyme